MGWCSSSKCEIWAGKMKLDYLIRVHWIGSNTHPELEVYKDTWFCSSHLKVPLKLPARQIPWNTGNTYTQSPLLFADIISLHPSHKTNVPPNRKAILQCITLSERTSAPHPVSLNLCLICLVLLWAFRSNYALSLPVESALPVNENVNGRWSQILLYLLPGRPNAAVSSLIWSE